MVATPEIRAFITAMSEVRVSVKGMFGDIAKYFKSIDNKKNLKLGMGAVGKQYIVCTFKKRPYLLIWEYNIRIRSA